MTIQDAITEYVRTELADELKSRWKDSQLLTFFKQAVRRANAVGLRNELVFMKTKQNLTLLSGVSSIALPEDFFSPIGLWLPGVRKLKHVSVDEFEDVISTFPLSIWTIDENKIELKNAADKNTALRLRYFKDVKPQNLMLSSQVPWDDKLTMMICEYVTVRAQNVDEYSVSQDSGLLSDFEAQILNAYAGLSPEKEEAVGVFTL